MGSIWLNATNFINENSPPSGEGGYMQQYMQLVERIAKSSGLEKEEILRRVEAKRAKLSGLISQEGAAQIVASELGIHFDKEKVKIGELFGLKKGNVLGKIVQMFPVRSYERNGKQGKIGSFLLADETSNVRVVLWDTNHIKLIEEGKIKEGDVVDISGAGMRNMELHLTGLSDIKLSSEILGEVNIAKVFYEKQIVDYKAGDRVKSRAVVVQVFEPRFFEVCSVCSARLTAGADGSICSLHGKVLPLKRTLLSIVLDDGTETVRAVLFQEQIEKFLGKEIENFSLKRDELLGKEAFFSGNVRQNKLFGNLELFIEEIEEIDVEELIQRLEKK